MKRMSQALEARRLVDQILDADPNAQIVVAGDFNAAPDEVPVMAIRGDPENTGNPDLVARVLVPIEQTIPAPARYTLFHQGRGEMLDHCSSAGICSLTIEVQKFTTRSCTTSPSPSPSIENIPSPITPRRSHL